MMEEKQDTLTPEQVFAEIQKLHPPRKRFWAFKYRPALREVCRQFDRESLTKALKKGGNATAWYQKRNDLAERLIGNPEHFRAFIDIDGAHLFKKKSFIVECPPLWQFWKWYW